MPRKNLTMRELLDRINKARPTGQPRLNAQRMMNAIYHGTNVDENLKISSDQLLTLVNSVFNAPEIYEPIADLIDGRRNEAMVSLINSHNPYTSNHIRDMTIFAGNPNPEEKLDNDIGQVELEVDGPYAMTMEWNFKGSPQKINKTIRIKYRYRARNLHDPHRPLLEPPHWVSAYLLIGYEDGGE